MGFLIAGSDKNRPSDMQHCSTVPCPVSVRQDGRSYCMGITCPVFEPVNHGAEEDHPQHGIGRCGLGR